MGLPQVVAEPAGQVPPLGGLAGAPLVGGRSGVELVLEAGTLAVAASRAAANSRTMSSVM
ncbi:hypothetical protein HCB39_28625 [Salinispora arenicola]|nr:hypothetical protein [Salinispora arenicola]